MAKYAEKTKVPAERSRAEIEQILTRYGADGFMYGWEGGKAIIAFRISKHSDIAKHIRFTLQMPAKGSSQTAWEQQCRQRWRALALVVKAKLEAVESGIVTFEQEFLAHIVLPTGLTVGEWATPQIEQVYLSGKMPQLLPGAKEE
jgi:hypothetical protein